MDSFFSVQGEVIGAICHRAKNDLQTVANLLVLASANAHSPLELAELLEGRIGAVSIPYTLVAQTRTSPTLKSLIQEVARKALGSFRASLRIQATESRLSLRLCSPLTLWLFEMIMNARQHALPFVKKPDLFITGETGPKGLEIKIIDNGPGLPPDSEMEAKAGLGMRLSRAMADHDLKGKMEFKSLKPGLMVSLWVSAVEMDQLNQGGLY